MAAIAAATGPAAGAEKNAAITNAVSPKPAKAPSIWPTSFLFIKL